MALSVTGLPERVEVASLERPNVHVWLDQQLGRSLRVEAVAAGKPAKNAALLGAPTVRPGSASVSGPEGAVERVARSWLAWTSAAWGRAQPSQPGQALDGRGMPVVGVSLEPSKVRVSVEIGVVTTKRVEVRPRVGKPAEGYKVLGVVVTPRTVAIKGARDAVTAIARVDTEWQGISKQTAPKTTYTVPLAFPSGVWPAGGVRTAEVEVTIGPAAPPPAPGSEATPGSTQWSAENAAFPEGGAESDGAQPRTWGPPTRRTAAAAGGPWSLTTEGEPFGPGTTYPDRTGPAVRPSPARPTLRRRPGRGEDPGSPGTRRRAA